MSNINARARGIPRLIDNAATASQNASLIDDEVTREAITINVAAPFLRALAASEAREAGLIAKLEKAKGYLAEANCPRPCNDRPYGFSIGECVGAGECGCSDGRHLQEISDSEVGHE
ncbi:hypothetical protein EL18_02115 [Nitratireductor basaltis]|uniref:Uncharacterized protein n=1 Tax=Nitratireductor basaltis TaxID=472175 RepID=A0A084UDN7_9HYPH|nr:hypothetical protein EL18_02115 [Nitratireductor basaltis]